MILVAFFLLQILHYKPDNKSYFLKRKVLVSPIFLELFKEKKFHLLPKFLHLVDNKAYNENTPGTRRPYKLKSIKMKNSKLSTLHTAMNQL